MNDLECRICCRGLLARLVYRGRVRAGRFGTLTEGELDVVECALCGARRLTGGNLQPADYESEDYRVQYNGDSSIEHYQRSHDNQQASNLARIGIDNVRGKTVADFGCGGGSFLDGVRGFAARTFAVEPARAFQPHLVARGHELVVSYGAELPPNSVDVAVSFQVLEHLHDPVAYLRDIARALRPGGQLHLTTPNREDVLMKLETAGYPEFFYRTAHLWYFDTGSLQCALEASGMRDVTTTCEHRYDLSNALCWLRDARPTGQRSLGLFAARLDSAWRGFLEEKMLGDTLWLQASKPL